MDLGLQDKHAIVTGGSRGIGKAIARELAREGADVAIVARNEADLEATARELATETNRRIVPLVADVTSKEQVDRIVAEAAQQLGGLHILVNSGSAPGGSATAIGPIETVIDEDLLQDFNTKYVGALRCSRAVIPFMKTEGWGRIINISGGNARNAGNLSGGARNAALVHMTKTLAVQLGRHGITVNCIHPGTTRTERTPRLLTARAAQLGVSQEEAEHRDFAPDSPRGMPSAAWWTLRRSRSSRSSWPRKRPGRSPASWCRQAEGPGGQYITEQRKKSRPNVGHPRRRQPPRRRSCYQSTSAARPQQHEPAFMPLNGHSSLGWQSRAFMRWLHGDRRLSRWLAKRWVTQRELLTDRPSRPCSAAGHRFRSRAVAGAAETRPHFQAQVHVSGETGVDALEIA